MSVNKISRLQIGLEKSKKMFKSQQKFRRESHNILIEKINSIAFSYNDDKRIQTPEGVISHS